MHDIFFAHLPHPLVRTAHEFLGDRPFACDQCEMAFASKPALKFHKKSVHGNIRDYKCDLCPKKFYERSHLVNHRRTHTGERPLACAQCDQTFITNGHLIWHRRRRHPADAARPHACAACAKTYRSVDRLRKHELKRHHIV
jgi:KRAB domain-containing zinc finger protein